MIDLASTSPATEIYSFGRFQLDRSARELFSNGCRLGLRGRGFDLLLALVEGDGAPVSRSKLLRRIWPDEAMTENNLEVQVSALRRLLGADRDMIKTDPGKGYRLAAPILKTTVSPPKLPGRKPIAGRGNIPVQLTKPIGREEDIDQAGNLLQTFRLLTLTGPGGIGKTTLAMATVHANTNKYKDGAWLIELATAADGNILPALIACTLGLQRLPLSISANVVANRLRDYELLLILDNCEHVVKPVARLVETFLALAPGVRILATSREPLRAQGEFVQPVPPLTTSPVGEEPSERNLQHSAHKMLVQRMHSAGACFNGDAESLRLVQNICRRLDGIPLAIELAAARAAALGLQAVETSLDNRFELLGGGRRTAHWRQQTLQATLDWSFELLSDFDREVFCRLGVFSASFTLEAAKAAIHDIGDKLDTVYFLDNLADRSWLVRELGPERTRYRLLESVREYALARLLPKDAFKTRIRHLDFYNRYLELRHGDGERAGSVVGGVLDYADFENIRSALCWSLTTSNQSQIVAVRGIQLAAAFMPLLLEASMPSECCRWADLAIARATPEEACFELVLQVVRGNVYLAMGADEALAEDALQRGLALALDCRNHEYALRAIYGLWVLRLHQNDYGAAYALAFQFLEMALVTGSKDDLTIGRRLIAASEHYLGQNADARDKLEQITRAAPLAASHSKESRFGVDQHVAFLTAMARVLTLQGALDRAMQTAREAVDFALRFSGVVSVCHARGELCIVSLWMDAVGDLGDTVECLMHDAERLELRFWRPHALVTKGFLAAACHGRDEALRLFEEAIRLPGRLQFDLLYPSLVGAVAEGMDRVGRPEAARPLVARALGRDWAMQRSTTAELLTMRAKLKMGTREVASLKTAEADFEAAASCAFRQSSHLQELRAAVGLTRLGDMTGRPSLGRDRLRNACGRLTEGHWNAYVREAHDLLSQDVAA